MDYTSYSNKIAIWSDIHLGVRRDSQKWHQIAIDWAIWYTDKLRQLGISDTIFMGDFFDSRSEVSVSTLAAGAKILDLFSDFNIIMIPGNHDCWYKDTTEINSVSIFKGRNNIKLIEVPTILTIQQKECLFLPWGYKEVDIKPVDVIFGHLEIQSFRMNSYKICEKGLSPKTLTENAKCTFTGHLHLRDERIYESSKIIYVGNPFQMDFGDIDSRKGFYTLDLKTWEHKFYENTLSPIHHKIAVSELNKFDNLNTPQSQEFFTNNIIKLIVDRNLTSDNIDILVKKISLLKPLALTLDYVITSSLGGDLMEGDLTGVDIPKIIDEFIGMLDNIPQHEVNEYCQELYKQCK